MEDTYAGCVYQSPPARFAPQGVEDLSQHALADMNLVGLPIRDSHESKCVVGEVVDNWQGQDGSKHISFKLFDQPDTIVQREGVKGGFYSHLSLSHEIGSPPKPLEVSICHRGRRPGTTINRSMSVEEYKRQTGLECKPEPYNAMDSQPSAPQPSNPPAEVVATPNEAAPVETPAPNASASPEFDASKYMEVFRKAADNLNDTDKALFIQGQLGKLRELEEAHKKISQAETKSTEMEAAHRQNINRTLNTIRNFFLQGADETPGADLTKIEGLMQEHPEAALTLNRVIECAHKRTDKAEAALAAMQQDAVRSAPERELMDRLRAYTRDSANPTYNYHFESNNAPMVSENANRPSTSSAPPMAKRKLPDNTNQMDMIERAMKRSVPARPTNIIRGE
jgi:hypothetical protein